MTGNVIAGTTIELTGNGINGSGGIGAVTPNTVSLTTDGTAVVISGQVTATTLTLKGTGSFTLNNEDNDITTLQTDEETGTVVYADANNFHQAER